jgi:hypothetical protein
LYDRFLYVGFLGQRKNNFHISRLLSEKTLTIIIYPPGMRMLVALSSWQKTFGSSIYRFPTKFLLKIFRKNELNWYGMKGFSNCNEWLKIKIKDVTCSHKWMRTFANINYSSINQTYKNV